MQRLPLKLSGVPTAISATIAIVAIVLLFLGLSDEDLIQRFLRLDPDSNPGAAALQFAAARAIRYLLAVSVVLLALLFIHVFARQDPATHESAGSRPPALGAIPVLPQTEAIDLVTVQLAKARSVSELEIWGFSLQWATPLYRFLREHKYPNLTVRLYVAGSRSWSMDMDYPGVSKLGLRARRETTIHQWLVLVAEQMVKGMRIYEVPLLSNDKGVRLGDELTLLGTYDYDCTEDGRLVFLPNPSSERRFLVCHDSRIPAVALLKQWCKRRYTCRRFDCEDITSQYTPAPHARA